MNCLEHKLDLKQIAYGVDYRAFQEWPGAEWVQWMVEMLQAGFTQDDILEGIRPAAIQADVLNSDFGRMVISTVRYLVLYDPRFASLSDSEKDRLCCVNALPHIGG